MRITAIQVSRPGFKRNWCIANYESGVLRQTLIEGTFLCSGWDLGVGYQNEVSIVKTPLPYITAALELVRSMSLNL